MNYRIEKNGRPAYLQLYDCFVRDIAAGVYPKGCRLPSKRTVASETGVSVITVEHAMNLLCEEGYTQARRRSGLFVTYEPSDFTAAEVFPGAPLPKAAAPAEQTFPFSVFAKAARKVLLDEGAGLFSLSPSQGLLPLRQELCAYLARSRGIHAEPEQVVVGAGAEYLYGLIGQLFSGHVFGLELPGYEKIRSVYTALGLPCRMLPLTAAGIAKDALASTDATVLHVTPFHSYPSGITVDISGKMAYLSWARRCGGWIIEDNYDSELTVSHKPENSLFAMSENENVIYVNTFSKTIAPAVRMGFMVLPPALSLKFREQLGFYACTVSTFEQYILAELLRSGDLERHINRVRRKRRGEKNAEAGITLL